MLSTDETEKQIPHDSDLDLVLRRLQEVRQSTNGPLQAIASLALSVYYSYQVSSLSKLSRECCEAVFIVVAAQARRNEAIPTFGAHPTWDIQSKIDKLLAKLHDVDIFARTFTSRGFLAAIFWRRCDMAKIKEYRTFMHDFILDDDFVPKRRDTTGRRTRFTTPRYDESGIVTENR
ncbi:hypothetical protein WG66_007884 [Moniliophthora roreri]|uniref:Uncharacterized protein n=1 Tax=Moniliophthora roreri TaxID=221103 RepID=A0A0W0G291_MONRR|nr:hypothetical protein WG66_007884 [Moniliophthora roreri]